MTYSPLHISGNQTGLVQSREEFILPNDAYPILNNAFVWRERIKRKQGCELLGRLQRIFTSIVLTPITLTLPSPNTFNLLTLAGISLVIEPNAEIIPGNTTSPLVIVIGAQTLTDSLGVGTFTVTAGNITAATIVYSTGVLTLTFTAGAGPLVSTATFSYSPGLPVMGIRIREEANSGNDQTVFFDTRYAYKFVTPLFQEFITGTTWTGTDSNFFWTTNYWVGIGNAKIFWATNYSGSTGDPIRYTDGTAWVDFAPIINVANDVLAQARVLLPFRGRLVAFNTLEGPALASSKVFSNRIRWAAIGTPFTTVSAIVAASNINANAWRDDIRGQGGFLDIPTSEDIISVGFVRDNLVIYCENSTWQLRYTGRTIAPFQIEKVNSELGTLSTFSTVQFDTSLVGIGDKGIVECDSYKSNLIDIKIPDYVFNLQSQNNGPSRIQAIRDFINRLAYWTICTSNANGTYPDQRLVYNYENDSWATFNDSYTALGTFQAPAGRTWLNTPIAWIKCNFSWLNEPAAVPDIVGGNQQGFIEYLDELTINDPSLSITGITSNSPNVTTITVVNHNLQTGAVIQISGIPNGTPFDHLNKGLNPGTGLPYNANNGVFGVVSADANTLQLNIYNAASDEFSTPQVDTDSGYIGGGKVAVRDNFNIVSKKFNFIDEGKSIQMGFLDILMDATEDANPGEISMNVYLDYNTSEASNTSPLNEINQAVLGVPDTFFNSIIPTTQSPLNTKGGTKFWQRVYCATRANFLTIEYTFNNAQMAGQECETNVQIDAQVLWVRPSGRMTQI